MRKMTSILLMALFLTGIIGIVANTIPTAEARGALVKPFSTAVKGTRVPMAARNYKSVTTSRIGAGSFALSGTGSTHGAGSFATNGNLAKSATVTNVPKGTKGLETKGYKPQPGERTIQGQVDTAVQQAGGNPTVQRGGRDLVRLRSQGHGQAVATATPQNVRNVTPDGRAFAGKGPDRTVTPRDIRELYKAQTGQGTSALRTRSGR